MMVLVCSHGGEIFAAFVSISLQRDEDVWGSISALKGSSAANKARLLPISSRRRHAMAGHAAAVALLASSVRGRAAQKTQEASL